MVRKGKFLKKGFEEQLEKLKRILFLRKLFLVWNMIILVTTDLNKGKRIVFGYDSEDLHLSLLYLACKFQN